MYTISRSIRKLKRATHRIAEGDFDYDPQIPPGDEVGDLARDFTSMAARLKVLEQMSLDASPLTRLPGNIAIERVLSKRLASNELFAVCYVDLDNFKAYNDRYGYIKASEVIKMTAEIVYEAVGALNEEDSFVGHVGGDDFIIVVSSDNAAPVCENVISTFDREIRGHYSAEDLAKGAIEGADRYGVHRIFPIMTISIAAIICQKGLYDSAVDIAKNAADMKEFLKAKPGSNYYINRRTHQRCEH
ncbi:GGDEF domain-containing protein [Geobacter sp. DSM 9736]|uniref:GGDEF domain-containing protein n=1 Tax=Geobacter sp. DSM 9736 TaxID=1277350 RepID=UPI00351311A1